MEDPDRLAYCILRGLRLIGTVRRVRSPWAISTLCAFFVGGCASSDPFAQDGVFVYASWDNESMTLEDPEFSAALTSDELRVVVSGTEDVDFHENNTQSTFTTDFRLDRGLLLNLDRPSTLRVEVSTEFGAPGMAPLFTASAETSPVIRWLFVRQDNEFVPPTAVGEQTVTGRLTITATEPRLMGEIDLFVTGAVYGAFYTTDPMRMAARFDVAIQSN